MRTEIYQGKEITKAPGVTGASIEGVVIILLERISDDRGAVFHMLRNDDKLFENFGEIYFSKVFRGAVKGWHLHKKMTLNYAVVYGTIKLVLYDDRKKSSTRGNILEIITGDENYLLIRIPPFIWNGFMGIKRGFSIVANCASIPHEKKEIERLDHFSGKIPYSWVPKKK